MQLHPSQTENIHIFPSVVPDVFEGDYVSSDNILRGHSEHATEENLNQHRSKHGIP